MNELKTIRDLALSIISKDAWTEHWEPDHAGGVNVREKIKEIIALSAPKPIEGLNERVADMCRGWGADGYHQADIVELVKAEIAAAQQPTLPITVREERMHPGMVKYHIEGLPRAVVIHHFTTTDGGPPHDHPWSFQSTVLAGGYVERVHQLDGSSDTVHRQPEDTFEIAAKHIHRIEELPTGECWTLILPRQHEQTSGFYEFREDGAWQRRWNESEWSKVE